LTLFVLVDLVVSVFKYCTLCTIYIIIIIIIMQMIYRRRHMNLRPSILSAPLGLPYNENVKCNFNNKVHVKLAPTV